MKCWTNSFLFLILPFHLLSQGSKVYDSLSFRSDILKKKEKFSIWNRNSVLYLVNRMPEEQKRAVHFYLDIGDDDPFYKGNSLLHIAMCDLNIPHEYRVRDGGHVWEYARTGLADALTFISQGFH